MLIAEESELEFEQFLRILVHYRFIKEFVEGHQEQHYQQTKLIAHAFQQIRKGSKQVKAKDLRKFIMHIMHIKMAGQQGRNEDQSTTVGIELD